MNDPSKAIPLRGLTRQDVEIIHREIAYQGHFKITRYFLKYKLFKGGVSEIIQREIFERGHAAAVLLLDPDQDKLLLIEQFRPGALNDPKSPWLLEIVAGIIDADETPEVVAIREAKEEANIEIEKLIPIGKYYVSPGGSTETMQLFCGKVDASKAGGIYGLATESEDIRVHIVDRKQAFTWVREGMINQAAAIIALQWLALNPKPFD